MRVSDKTSVQPRRFLKAAEVNRIPPKKKKFTLKKFLPTFHKESALPKGSAPNVSFIHKRPKTVIGAGLGVLVVAAASYGYYQYQQNPAVIYLHKLHTLTQAVGEHTVLPTNETPVIATVSDVTKLPKEAFFANAQNGDKILMYKKDKKAILYRPSTDQVITTAVLDFRNVTPTPAMQIQAVAGASTSALASSSANAVIIGVTPVIATPAPFIPHGKVLVQPE